MTTTTRAAPINVGAIVNLNNFIAKSKFTKALATNDGVMVDIPLSDLDAIFASNLPIHASVNLCIEIYFETNNRKLFEMNQPLPANTTIASELLKLSFEKTPELHIPQFHLTNT